MSSLVESARDCNKRHEKNAAMFDKRQKKNKQNLFCSVVTFSEDVQLEKKNKQTGKTDEKEKQKDGVIQQT